MARPVELSCSRTYPVPAESAFRALLPTPLEQIFVRRYGPIPAIRSTDGADGAWGVVGQTRTVHLAGGGTLREELVDVQPPRRFAYTLRDVTGPLKPLATHIDGAWTFDPVGTGVRIGWRWTVHPTAVGAVAMPAFGWLWRGYATRALQRIETLLVPTSERGVEAGPQVT